MKQSKTKQKIDLSNQKTSLGTMGDLLRKAGLPISKTAAEAIAKQPSAEKNPERETLPSYSMDRIHIRVERKHRGGKTVTIIEGLLREPAQLTDLLKQMKADFGCGGAIEDGAVVLQGDMQIRVREWLENRN